MIKFLKKIIKNMGNKEFVDYVMSYKADPYQIHFEDGGESYPDKNILLIRNDHSSHGLFAELRMTLNYLALSYIGNHAYIRLCNTAETMHLTKITDAHFQYSHLDIIPDTQYRKG